MPVVSDIPRGKSAWAGIQKNLGASVHMEETEQWSGSECDYRLEVGENHCRDGEAAEHVQEVAELISNLSLHSLNFKVMLRSFLPTKKNIKQSGCHETEFRYTTKAEDHHLVGEIPDTKSVMATSRVNAL